MAMNEQAQDLPTLSREIDVDGLRVVQVDGCRWIIPRQGLMRVEGLVFASSAMMGDLVHDQAIRQVANVACLPGIVGRSIGMPDIHWGYGFAIGGVAAFDPAQGGVVSPGGVGYDINCGVRLLRSDIDIAELRPLVGQVMDSLYERIPAGVGSHYRNFRLETDDLRGVLFDGAAWTVKRGFGVPEDLDHIEAGGRLDGAVPDFLSPRALQRGGDQLGTVGSGNHFIEVGYVDGIYDAATADAFGLRMGAVTVLIHSGSRGLGYQVCDDFLADMVVSATTHGIVLPDRQLACAPLGSSEAQRYFGAMNAAANYAFANRQMMAHHVRETFETLLGRSWSTLGMRLVYDVAHNIAKWERHVIDGVEQLLCVHRKGATRAFPAGHPDVPVAYRHVGQPVIIPGDMGRYSFVLVGTDRAYNETFGSSCHGAGRRMSRTKAKRSLRGRDIAAEMKEIGVEIRAASYGTVAEEIPEAYKNITEVVDVVDESGIGRKVARLKPVGVLKG